MGRSYGRKGQKRKRTNEKYDREEEEEKIEEASYQAVDDEETEKEENGGGSVDLEGIPLAPSEINGRNKHGVIFILEKASLEVAKVGKSYKLLNSDDHMLYLQQKNKNPAHYRPDILHQALLMILDSPLNKAGRVRAVYVRTETGVLIEVKPFTRIPRTFKRFANLILQLLQKLSISPPGKREKLMRVIKNPVMHYLPVNSRKIGLSYSSEKLVNIRDYVAMSSNDTDHVFVVGAMAHGKIEADYIDDFIAVGARLYLKWVFEKVVGTNVSGYPLSAAYCITMICQAWERKWNIL